MPQSPKQPNLNHKRLIMALVCGAIFLVSWIVLGLWVNYLEAGVQ